MPWLHLREAVKSRFSLFVILFIALSLGAYICTVRESKYGYSVLSRRPNEYLQLLDSSKEIIEKKAYTTEFNLTEGICTQQVRKFHLANVCSKYKDKIQVGESKILADPSRHLLSCPVSKASCTTFKGLWEKANLYGPATDIMFEEAHNKSVMINAGLKREGFKQEKYKEYTKFLVVRHPFSRIISAYQNILNMDLYNYGPGNNERLKDMLDVKFHLKHNISALKLSQFLEVILDEHFPFFHDRHWKPIFDTCDPCNIKYDHIIRVETMTVGEETDAMPVLRKMGYNTNVLQDVHLNNRKQTSSKAGTGNDRFRAKYLNYFNNVPRHLINKMVSRYSVDLELFGYHYDSSEIEPSCGIVTENNQMCC